MFIPIIAAVSANTATTTAMSTATRTVFAARNRNRPPIVKQSEIPDCDDPDARVNKETK